MSHINTCSTISGCPHRYAMLFAPVHSHWSAYLRDTGHLGPKIRTARKPFSLRAARWTVWD